jgi:hypothetical protein
MTLAMPDSTVVANLPSGYDAYLGYADGDWPTAKLLRAKFPAAELVVLTVTGNTIIGADGCDIESGDLTTAGGVSWANRKMAAVPGFRPVLYASVGAMDGVLEALGAAKIRRDRVRLLSAHYGAGAHICGPVSCGEVQVEMDGTQWTNQFGFPNVDMSVVAEDFFDQPLTRTEMLVQELGTVRQGDTGNAVKTVQGLLGARGYPVSIDGIFGPATFKIVATVQARAEITADGIVGPVTWPALLGVA